MAIIDFLKNKHKNSKKIMKEEDPCYVSICLVHSGFSVSPISLTSTATMGGTQKWGRTFSSCDMQPINEARNYLVEQSLKNELIKYVLLIENDIVPHPGTLPELASIDADIISVPTFSRREPYLPNVYKNASEPFIDFYKYGVGDKEVRAIDIHASDAGCILIKRNVLEDEKMQPLFQYTNKIRSDVYEMTSRAKELGYSVMCTTKLTCGRVVPRVINFQDFKTHVIIKDKLKPGATVDEIMSLVKDNNV